ncbi:MAG: serine/threonine-protein kinase [Elusimicrobiota bacterium]|jgi:tRNA A-37 threonylcarbamoyl transferase component Bud32
MIDAVPPPFRGSGSHGARLKARLEASARELAKALASSRALDLKAAAPEPEAFKALERLVREGAWARALDEALASWKDAPWSRAHYRLALTLHLRLPAEEWPDAAFDRILEALPPSESQELYYEWALRLEKRGFIDRARRVLSGLGGKASPYRDVAERVRGLEAVSWEESRTVAAYAAGLQAGEGTAKAALGVVAGKFELLEPLGRGGMGYVYKARDKTLDRIVALKRVLTSGNRDRDLPRLLREEAKVVASLEHPYIVVLHEIVEDEGSLYLVFSHVDGETLQEVLARERILPPAEAVRVLRFAAEALAFAHSRGVVHRDVKPANLMRDRFGYVKLMDFGIARHVRESLHGKARGDDPFLAGTPAYMAPEQQAGSSVPRSDVYGLGVTAYEMLSGSLPFSGPDMRRLKEEGRFAALPKATPVLLAGLVASCLKPDPKDRPDMPAVQAALAVC